MARNRKRGRTVLVWTASLFVAVQLLASGLLDYCWPQIRFPKLYEQLTRFDTVADSVNVVFLGSSRTGCLIDEGAFNEVAREVTGDSRVTGFNAFVPAGDPVLCERMLQRLLEHGARPRYAVIEVSPEGITERTAWLSMYVGWALRWDDAPTYLRDMAVTGNLVRYAGTRIIPLYVYRDQIRQQLAEGALAWWRGRGRAVSSTFVPPFGLATASPVFHATDPSHREPPQAPATKWDQRVATALALAPVDARRTTTVSLEGVHRELRRYRAGGNAAAALDRLLKRCRSHGIEPILVCVPLSSGHRNCYDAEIEAAFQAYLAALCQKHGCRYIDQRTMLPDHFFVDHHHAGPEGGLLYSQKMALEVVGPMWK